MELSYIGLFFGYVREICFEGLLTYVETLCSPFLGDAMPIRLDRIDFSRLWDWYGFMYKELIILEL